MYQKERMDHMMELLRRHGYVTVKFLTEELGYSTATINRDLNRLEQMQMVKRSYGGVEPFEAKSIPLPFRYEKSKPAKKRIGKRAASFVKEGDVIFIDGTTTTQYMGQYLLDVKNIKVITNNMALAMFLAENGVRVVVLGGEILEPPFMLDGTDTAEAAEKYRADKCFFSMGAFSEDGMIGGAEGYYALHRVMLRNSERAFLLMDGDKLGRKFDRVLCDLSAIDCLITDHVFDRSLLEAYPELELITVPAEEPSGKNG